MNDVKFTKQTSNAIGSITVNRIVFQPVIELCFRVY